MDWTSVDTFSLVESVCTIPVVEEIFYCLLAPGYCSSQPAIRAFLWFCCICSCTHRNGEAPKKLHWQGPQLQGLLLYLPVETDALFHLHECMQSIFPMIDIIPSLKGGGDPLTDAGDLLNSTVSCNVNICFCLVWPAAQKIIYLGPGASSARGGFIQAPRSDPYPDYLDHTSLF